MQGPKNYREGPRRSQGLRRLEGLGSEENPEIDPGPGALRIAEETAQRLARHLEEHVTTLYRKAAGVSQTLMPAQNQAGSERKRAHEPPGGPKVDREWREIECQ